MTSVLEGIHVVDLTGESGALAARVLADLGATVTRPEPLDGGHLGRQPHRHAAWTARTEIRPMAVDDPALDTLLGRADIVLATRGHGVDTERAPRAVWVHLSPFGLTGPRAVWRAGDLGILAATGNLFATGDPDRAPVRCAEPVAFAHAGPEAAFAALTGLLTGRPQQIDVSIQEAVMVASMGGAGRYARDPDRGQRLGANIGRTREIWPCADGWVSFGLRGGKARIPSLETLSEQVGDPVLIERDWTTFSPATTSDEDLAAIEEAVGAWFGTKTMGELFALACETNLMLAPVNSPASCWRPSSWPPGACSARSPASTPRRWASSTSTTVRPRADRHRHRTRPPPIRPSGAPSGPGPGRGSWSSAPGRPARSPPATSPSTVRT